MIPARQRQSPSYVHVRLRRTAVLPFLALLSALILALPGVAGGQDLLRMQKLLEFTRKSEDAGLSHSDVSCIAQDKTGFMWFGTRAGLNRFDGYRFTQYHHRPGNPRSLSDNTINALLVDREGVLWIGTSDGLNRFDATTEEFIHYRHDARNPRSLSHNAVLSLCEDQAGALWVGTADGSNKLDRASASFSRFLHPLLDSTLSMMRNVTALAVCPGASAPSLLVGTWGSGLYLFNTKTGQYTRCVGEGGLPNLQSRQWVSSISTGPDGRVWITDGSLHLFLPAQAQLRRVSAIPSGPLSDVFSAAGMPSGEIIAGLRPGGLIVLDSLLQISASYTHDPLAERSLCRGNINTLFRSRSGILWIGSTSGIALANTRRKNFFPFYNRGQTASGLKDGILSAALPTRSGKVWISYVKDGLTCVDETRQQVTHLSAAKGRPGGLANDHVMALYEDSQERLWLGTWGSGVGMRDPVSGRFRHFTHEAHNPASVCDDFVESICETRERELWVGTAGGVSVLSLDSIDAGRFTRYLHSDDDSTSLSAPRASVIMQDRKGRIWIGTSDGGLNLFNRATRSFRRFRHDPYDPHSISANNLLAIFEDSKGRIWIGTWGGGLDQYDPARNRFLHLTEEDGLPRCRVSGITEDARGTIWLSTNIGLTSFDPDTRVFRNFEPSDGLAAASSMLNALRLCPRTGRIYRTSGTGLTVFHPDSIETSVSLPPVVLTSVSWFDLTQDEPRRTSPRGASLFRELTVSHSDVALTFEFAALEFSAPERNSYRYMLEGFDDRWTSLASRREVSFTNLDPGEYRLRVQASNSDGMWNRDGFTLRIVVRPPWWKTLWAYAAYGLLSLALVLGVASAQRKRVVRAERLQAYAALQEAHAELVASQAQIVKLSQAVEQSPAIVLITDTNGRIEYVNPKFTSVSGYTLDDVRGKTPRILKSGAQSDEAYAQLWQAIRGGREWNGELHNRRKDGTLYWVSAFISPLLAADGSITHFIGIQEDITERRQTAEALAKRTEELETIDRIVKVVNKEFELVPLIRALLEQGMQLLPNSQAAGAFIYDASLGGFRWAAAVGYEITEEMSSALSLDELTERYITHSSEIEAGVHILRHTADLPGEDKLRALPWAQCMLIMAVHWDAARSGNDGYLVFDNLTDPDAFTPDDARTLNRFREHAISALAKASSLQAMTAKNQEVLHAQQQLHQQQKMAALGQLTAGVAHEIRNPLNFILSFSSYGMELMDEYHSAETRGEGEAGIVDEVTALLRKIHEHGKRADGIVSEMLLHARGRVGRLERAQLNDVVEQALALAGPADASGTGVSDVRIARAYAPDLAPMNIFIENLTRALLNLIGNALYALRQRARSADAPPGYVPELRLTTAALPDGIEIRIKDNGPGIPKEVLARIFDPFFTTKPTGEGTGLGLTITYDIIEKDHGGTLTVQSAPGEGTEFVIFLPATRAQ